jgi:transposase
MLPVLKPETWPVWLGEKPADVLLTALLSPYRSDQMICWRMPARNCRTRLAILVSGPSQSEQAVGFEILPCRWVVERTLAWLNRNRRLAKDFEASIASAKAWLFITSVQLMLRRVART